jgi:hypothetical protein
MVEIQDLTQAEAHQIKRAMRLYTMKKFWTEQDEFIFSNRLVSELSEVQSMYVNS